MTMLAGFDVSQWNRPGVYPSGSAFAWVRATYGNGNDPAYYDHVRRLKALGLVVGAYHFGVGGEQANVVDQANRFLRQANPGGEEFDADILALDLEGNGGAPSMTTAEADAFVRQIQRAGRRIGLYHSRSAFPLAISVHFNFRWVADYTAAARLVHRPLIASQWTFWQWTSTAPAVGDRDWFNGDKADLAALVKASHV